MRGQQQKQQLLAWFLLGAPQGTAPTKTQPVLAQMPVAAGRAAPVPAALQKGLLGSF